MIPLNIGTYWQCTISIKTRFAHCLDSLEKNQGTVYVKLAARQQSLGSSAVETLKKNKLQHVAAGCWRWNNNEQKKGDYQHVPFHANIKNIANTNLKTALHITPRAAVKTVLFRFKKNNDFLEMCYFVWENKKIRNFEKEHVAAGWWSWSNNEQKKADYQHVPFHANVKIHCKYQ